MCLIMAEKYFWCCLLLMLERLIKELLTGLILVQFWMMVTELTLPPSEGSGVLALAHHPIVALCSFSE